MRYPLWFALVGCMLTSATRGLAQVAVATGEEVHIRRPVTRVPVGQGILLEAIRHAVVEPRGTANVPVQSADDAAWSRVRSLPAGQEVRVVFETGASSQGTFRTADAGSMTLRAAGHDQNLTRATIRRISMVADRDRWQHIVTGLVIGGVAASIAVGLHCRGESAACTEIAPAYVAPGTGAGAALGALLPRRKVWQEIYSRSGS